MAGKDPFANNEIISIFALTPLETLVVCSEGH
jgi:hypothetical protein